MKHCIQKVTLFFLLLISLDGVAGDLQPITGILKTISGSPVTVGQPSAEVEVQAFTQAGSMDYNVRNVVSLNFDKSSMANLPSPTEVKVNVTVSRWDASNNVIGSPVTEDLVITSDNRYNRKTVDKALLKLADGYKVKVVINSVTVGSVAQTILPDYVFVESEIYITRYFNYSGTTIPSGIVAVPVNTDCDVQGIYDEIQINWAVIPGAEEYQLEWTYVNDYGLTAGSSKPINSLFADFKGNSTRITTSLNSYNVSLAFEKGYIAYRIRGVGRDYLAPDKYIYGYWSTGANDYINLGAIGSANYYYNNQEHEKTKNWQYSSTFAEEGKKKEVISYFDGSLHNRQSVTKINSDNNVIVGETIYDFQGRPAINVLPTPVNFPNCSTSTDAPSLKYYENFNRNNAGVPYTKEDFDKDLSGNNCSTATSPMANTSGSSQYYSENNPDQLNNQAFVPDAQLYPFSQVEYTPDNTGRVRAQSGVGPTFQLGSTHETKYIYSQPNQIQLDRLFGSEVGDASHYKKNTVIDANGQTSISYLNQEGKTIATSLAGNPPTANNTVFMEALPSEANAAVEFTVDAFNKDANGHSNANVVNASSDGIEFSTQLSVSYNSTYNFSYEIEIDTLADPCLNQGFCISCIYDLEIKVTDECGAVIMPSNAPIAKKVGHLTASPNGYTMTCSSPTETDQTEAFTVNLTPGVYTVSKMLTIDKDARDFYLAKYLDSASGVSHCVKTLNDFIEEALSQIDTSDCYVSCADCAAALGSKDDFISSGQGTDLQYELLLENCLAPCKDMTLCEATYEMLLLDVTPGGQYAKYDALTNTSGDALSVLNTGNTLPANVGAPSSANWHHPKLIIGGQIYEQYINDNGERVKVNVYPVSTPNGWSPEILNSGAGYLFTDLVTGQKYVYPENLKHLSDFLPVWNTYFARSLVVYHPEFAYYIACKDQSNKFTGDDISTEQFDSLLVNTTSFDQAVTNGLIKPGFLTITNPNNRIYDWFTHAAGHAYDPFFSNPSAFDSFKGPFPSSYGMSISFNQLSLVTEMQGKMNVYQTIPSVGNYTIVETAAILARCGNNYYATPTAACMQFGSDFYPNPLSNSAIEHLNDSIRDIEWQNLKNFYISEKRKLQFKRMDFFAKFITNSANPNQPGSEMLGGCNACIGNNSYNPYTLGMFSFPPSSFNPSWDPSQPCSFFSSFLFANKQKRFVDLNNTGLNANNIGYQIYQQTGQCPMAFQLQNFISGIVQANKLTTSNFPINTIGGYSPDLYNALNNGVNPTTFINYEWSISSISSSFLQADIINPSTNNLVCQLSFDLTGTPIIDFTKIISVQALSYDHTSGGQYYFKLGVGYKDAANNLHSAIIIGSSCINIVNCSFAPECDGNTLAVDFMNLVNIMGTQGLTSQTNYSLSSNPLTAPLITPVIKNTLGASTSNLIWNFVAPDKVELFENGNPSDKLIFTIISFTPSSAAANTIYYANIRSNYSNLFKMDAYNASNVKIADVDGKAEKVISGITYALSMGSCGFPDNPDCVTNEHKVREDLELLLSESLTQDPFTGNINLYTKAGFTTLLKSYFPVSLNSTSSVYTHTTSYDSILFNTGGACNIEIYHDNSHPGALNVNFSQIVSIRDLTGIQPYDSQQNFHRFYFIGKFDQGGGVIVEDTVFGNSCLPLKNCNICEPVYDTTINGGVSLSYLDSINVIAGKANYDMNVVSYGTYNNVIDSLNNRYSWAPNDPEFVGKIDYLTFAQKDYQYADKYFDYVRNYDTIVDSAQFLSIDLFVSDYGNFTNCTKEYERYARAINKYNSRAVGVGATLLNPITDSSFYVNKLCDQIVSYIKYLNVLPDQNTLTPLTVYQYYSIGTPPPADSCDVLYKQYLTAYKQFTQNSTAQNACKVAKTLHPLYSFGAIQKNNLCCSNQGLALFNNYINGLIYATNTCPPLLQSLDSCSAIIQQEDINPQFCQRNYIYFINRINKYNESNFAMANSHSLDPNIYPTYKLFQKAGYCDCIIDYINYLNDYITAPANASLPLPVDIDHFPGCTHTVYPPSPADECKIKYQEYLSIIDEWNSFIALNDTLNYQGIKTIFTYQQFVNLYCNCADKFIAQLTAIINGQRPTVQEVEELVYLPNACSIPECPRIAPDSVFSFPPVPYSQNPCVAQMIAGAIQNAMNAYDQYVDSVTTNFVDRYNAHCLNALENLHYTYTDKEYHFTLYYYDQAGNLVKTIPPAGIEMLPIVSDVSPVEVNVKKDRTFNTHTVFTSHRMATTYEYNSLNQLVRQDMPDHDKMDICEQKLPNGLDADLTTVGVQMINSNKGFLTGYLSRTIAGTTINRGYVYTTNDGGVNWTRVKGLAGGDIQKVQMVTSTVGYAVANYGLVFKTLDGGYSWDVLTTLYNASPKYFDKLNDLYFENATTGIVGGNNGKVYKTTNGGLSYTSSTGFNGNDIITGLTHDGSSYYASVTNNGEGRIYKSADGITWVIQNVFTVNDLKKVQYLGSNNKAIAVGYDGTLLRSNTGNTSWSLVATNIPYSFSDVYFKSENYGVALVDSVPGMAKIYKTLDGGNNWILLSAPGKYYSSLQKYDSTKVMAAGENGLLSKVLMNLPPFAISNVNTSISSISDDFKYVDAVNTNTGKLVTLAVSGTSTVRFTYDALASTINWESFNTGVASGFKKGLISVSNGSSPVVSGILLGNDGIVYQFYRTYLGTPVYSAITTSASFITDITSDNGNNTMNFYAFDSNSNAVYNIVYSGASVSSVLMTSPGISTPIRSISMNNNGSRLMLTGDNGTLVLGSGITPGASTVTWQNVSVNIAPLPLNDIAVSTANMLNAVGNDGTQWFSINGGSNWTMAVNGSSDKFNAIKLNSSGVGIIGANNGKVYSCSAALSSNPILTPITTSGISHVTDVAIASSGNNAFATSSNGKAAFINNYASSTTSVTALAANANGGLNGMCFIPSAGGLAVAGGDKSGMILFGGSTGIIINDVFTHPLKSTHFYDANNGYVVDSGYVIRHTNNGGATWDVVLPQNTTPVISKVYSTGANKAIVIGKNTYAAVVNGNASPVNATVSVANPSLEFNDINFNSAGKGIIVGNQGEAYKINSSGSTYAVSDIIASPATTNFSFNAVHVFNDGNFIAVGNKGNIYYYNGSAFIKQTNYPGGPSNSVKFYDVYFHDDRVGYVVGAGGKAFKCSLISNIENSSSPGMTTDGITWSDFCPLAVYGSHTPSNVDFTSIAFNTRTNGFIAGRNNQTNAHQHALLLNDESMLYSTRFWYDKLGRMVVSQNTRQYPQKYSYTLYDELGRIVEVGEKYENTTANKQPGIFGTNINGLFNTKAIDDNKLLAWINDGTGARKEVTKTYYDITVIASLPIVQENLRKRVASVTYEDVFDGNPQTFDHGTHYTYDIHGNVNTLLQDNKKMYEAALASSSAITTERFKRIDYDYDLISGKVNKVSYQASQPDQFYHRYSYDADNRITKVETSSNELIWDMDAKYFYYAHGPLARVEYGHDKVQGLDYAYTLQGWIKGINSTLLDPSKDMGKDGLAVSAGGGSNALVARDAMSYSLNYYQGDYNAINQLQWSTVNNRFEAATAGSELMAARYDLFNGNISSMVTSLVQVDTIVPSGLLNAQITKPSANAYKYDQLNRLKSSVGFNNISFATNEWSASGQTVANMYANSFTYDANGNILTQHRSDALGAEFDAMIYQYEYLNNDPNKLLRNRLYHVNDNTAYSSLKTDDIDDQGAFNSASLTINQNNNYSFDAIGNLTKDLTEQINNIEWTVYGKIKAISRTSGSTKDNLTFDYDASGNRIAKHVYTSANQWKRSTYYIRDAQGNVMSTYEHTTDAVAQTVSFKLIEQHLYGSSRLGMNTPDYEMVAAVVPADGTPINHILGKKQFELSNHLGNVLSVVSDRKLAIDINSDLVTDFYQADILSQNDYYPFGSVMSERAYSIANGYRYGFNGKEKDDEIKGIGNEYVFLSRIYDPRLGKWLSCDKFSDVFPAHSVYNFALCNPIFVVDPDGNTVFPYFYSKNSELQYKTALSLVKKDDVFNALYKYLDEDYNLPKKGGKKGFHLVLVTDISNQEYERIRKQSGKSDNFHFSGVTMKGEVTSNSKEYVERTNIKQTNFTYSNTYEELFHAGQNQFYQHDNNGDVTSTTRELEAKVAKIQAFYLGNKDLSASEMSKKMDENGFSEYEKNFLISDKKEFNTDVVNYFSGTDMSIKATSPVYDEITNFKDRIIGGYEMKFSQSITTYDFKFLNFLQKSKTSSSNSKTEKH